MQNKYPLWKNIMLVVIMVFAVIYAAPNLFGEDPSVQISGQATTRVDANTVASVESALKEASLSIKAVEQTPEGLLVRFFDENTQFKAKDIIKKTLGDNYTVALNLAPITPHWLTMLGAMPMKLGLDLRGGVNFLLGVDVDAVVKQRTEGSVRVVTTSLREAGIRYVDLQKTKEGIIIQLRDPDALTAAYTVMHKQLPEFEWLKQINQGVYQLFGKISPQALKDIRQSTVDQMMTVLRNRVNELGVSEALVQQQGSDRIAVALPGVQDTAQAKDIIGGTATLEFRMVDLQHDPRNIVGGVAPPGSRLYTNTYNDRPILLKDQIILAGSAITDAAASFGEDGRAIVTVRLGGGGESYFYRVTRDNIGKSMAVVYQETKTDTKLIDDKPVKVTRKIERVITVATIKDALGNNFQITGVGDPKDARNLALLLRAGALVAPIEFLEERTIGPSLGMDNIRMGVLSIVIGFVIVVIFMAFYYRLFGLIADLALTFNLIFLVALLSLLGMTLTLPGMAGIVLTVGMAVDANVLIFERIREELRNGASPQASIYAGYDRALTTIIDANVTTLIVALILFGVGTGAVKGFAVTLSLGLMTSMLTGIMFTRALVNAIYGGRQVKRLSIGI